MEHPNNTGEATMTTETQAPDDLAERGLTIAEARKWFRYDPDAGALYWAIRSSNAARMDRPAGKLERGYWSVMVNGRLYRAHRIIWAMHYGEWPDGQVDHINHIRADNRIENLRVVPHLDNHRNMSLFKNNTTGIPGVRFDVRYGSWTARITVNYKQINLGSYKTKEEAIAARKKAEVEYGFHPNHGRKEGFGK
jgi:hypothetical protein